MWHITILNIFFIKKKLAHIHLSKPLLSNKLIFVLLCNLSDAKMSHLFFFLDYTSQSIKENYTKFNLCPFCLFPFFSNPNGQYRLLFFLLLMSHRLFNVLFRHSTISSEIFDKNEDKNVFYFYFNLNPMNHLKLSEST